VQLKKCCLDVDHAKGNIAEEVVARATASAVLETTSAAAYPDVRAEVVIEHPDTVLSERDRAGERAAVLCRGSHFRVHRGRTEYAGTQPLHFAIANRTRQPRPAYAVCLKSGPASNAAEGDEGGARIQHVLIVRGTLRVGIR